MVRVRVRVTAKVRVGVGGCGLVGQGSGSGTSLECHGDGCVHEYSMGRRMQQMLHVNGDAKLLLGRVQTLRPFE